MLQHLPELEPGQGSAFHDSLDGEADGVSSTDLLLQLMDFEHFNIR
jgi:hypothetical protein